MKSLPKKVKESHIMDFYSFNESSKGPIDEHDLDQMGFYDLDLVGQFNSDDWTIEYPKDWTRKQCMDAIDGDCEKIESIDIPFEKSHGSLRKGHRMNPYIILYPDVDD